MDHFQRNGLHPLLLALCLFAGQSMAQIAPLVTDADIERAKTLQPSITEEDLQRAQRRHRMPSEQDLHRVPVPAFPKIDALPQPSVAPAIDLEALAKGYEGSADRIAAGQGLASGPGLLIFVSFSIPEPTLARLVDQAARSEATLVIRGLLDGSMRTTVARVHRLTGEQRVAFQIDPQAFERFGVSTTPTFVLVHAGSQPDRCSTGLCMPRDAFVATSGDVSLDYALEYIERSSPRFAKDARRYLKKLKG
jgi:conjugal transfer pilus assembly protein TrbC